MNYVWKGAAVDGHVEPGDAGALQQRIHLPGGTVVFTGQRMPARRSPSPIAPMPVDAVQVADADGRHPEAPVPAVLSL
ncbi:MAG: hypothetical protein R3D63_10100 [Paracoccaceae bacterium]